jgi:bifunctional DNase/RNase
VFLITQACVSWAWFGQRIELEVAGIYNYDSVKEQYRVVFQSKLDRNTKLEMVMGKSEASAIAIELEHVKPTAPMPLDLFYAAFLKIGYTVREVEFDSVSNGIFHAKVICSNGNRSFQLDARPADATALAYKFKCPIYCDKKLINK